MIDVRLSVYPDLTCTAACCSNCSRVVGRIYSARCGGRSRAGSRLGLKEGISGNGKPSFGTILGNFALSNGQTDTGGLIRAVPSRLQNISTRGFVGSGEQVLIAGFIIGDGGKTVLMDAKGPSLAGIADPVNATQISLFSNGQLIASNNGWRNNANVAEIAASGLAPANDKESALQVSLEPGAYTVVVASGDGSTGIGLVEVYGVGDTQGP